jgi:DNA repair exonuclease SbcCD nuclease subunit
MTSICCISDCHLGYRHRLKKQRLRDYANAFNDAIDKVVELSPSLLILGGDMFHHSKPDPKSMQTLVKRLMKFADSIPVVMCIGNHEIETHLGSTYTPILSDIHENIHVLTTESPHIVLEFNDKRVGIHGFQYIRNRKLAEETLEKISEEISGNDYDILCIHQAVEHYLEPCEISIRAVREIAAKYDLILLGHVHKHQQIKEISDVAPAFYVGSTERISFNEWQNQNGFLIFRDFQFRKPEFMPVKSAGMRVIKENLGKMKPADINDSVEKIIRENLDVNCLQIAIDAEIDGDYFDICHDWDNRYKEFTVLDVSVAPKLLGGGVSLERLEIGERIFDDYFEKMCLNDKADLKDLCERMYEKYGT